MDQFYNVGKEGHDVPSNTCYPRIKVAGMLVTEHCTPTEQAKEQRPHGHGHGHGHGRGRGHGNGMYMSVT
jgi:hypothetical protein